LSESDGYVRGLIQWRWRQAIEDRLKTRPLAGIESRERERERELDRPPERASSRYA
jgi:hypothetical protein